MRELPIKQRRTILLVFVYIIFTGMMFWYGIEQLFIERISEDHVKIKSYTIIAYSLTYAALNVLTGSFSDKYGRKTSLMIAAALQAVVVFLLGLSDSALIYIILSGAYALPTAFSSGAPRALIYDSLVDVKLESLYPKLSGFISSLFLTGAAIANIFSGFIADSSGLEFAYFVSVVPAIISLIAVSQVYEPAHHKTNEESIFEKISIAGKAIRSNSRLLMLTIMLIFTLSTGGVAVEFGQAQFLEVSDSATKMGLFWFVAAAVMSLFAYLGGRLIDHALYGTFMLILVSALMLFIGSWAGLVLVVIIMSLVEAVVIFNDVYVNKEIPSNIRNTVSSTLRTFANIMLVPLFYVGGVLSDYMSVRVMIASVCLGVASIAYLSFVRYLNLSGTIKR